MGGVKLVIISPNAKANQTRKIRRGFLNSEMCTQIRVLAFERADENFADFEYKSLGKIAKMKYLGRIPILVRAIIKASKELSNCDAVFTWTLDCLIVTILSRFFSGNRKCKIIYNVRDVHNTLTGRGVKAALFRAIDKFASRFVSLFVFTSPAYENYYKNILHFGKLNWIAVENKIPEELWSKAPRPKNSTGGERIIIGYFGLMSYPNSWEIIKDAARCGMNFYIRGHNYLGKSFIDDLKSLPNIVYGGSYKNPEDMSDIFGRIDVSWAVNSSNFTPNTNDQWAICNRFYEGIYFRKPLIVQEGSALSDFITKNDIGITVDVRNRKDTVESILSITHADVERWKSNIAKIDEPVFKMQKKEYAKILKLLFC